MHITARNYTNQQAKISKLHVLTTLQTFALFFFGTTRVTTHTCYSIAATAPELTIDILNSVF